MYYPCDIPNETRGQKRRRRLLWDPRKLPRRTHHGTKEIYRNISETIVESGNKEVEGQCKDFRLASTEMTLISRMPHMKAFDSFPIDLMNLLYLNIAKDIVSIWMNNDPEMADVAILSRKGDVLLVDSCIDEAGSGIGNMVMRPGGISKRGQWKAIEWKVFVNSLSMVALHDVVSEQFLDGWWLFVQLSQTISQWKLSARDLENISKLTRKFYKQFKDRNCREKEDRIHFNK